MGSDPRCFKIDPDSLIGQVQRPHLRILQRFNCQSKTGSCRDHETIDNNPYIRHQMDGRHADCNRRLRESAIGDQGGRKMNPKKQILKFIQNAYSNTSQSFDAEKRGASGNNDSRNDIFQELFDGMSSGTARIVIEQELNRSLDEEFNIDKLENQGRYYMARIVRPDGIILQRLLVDKQTGTVRLVGA